MSNTPGHSTSDDSMKTADTSPPLNRSPEKPHSSLPDLIKDHWLTAFVVFGSAVAGATWAIASAVLVQPRDFEINRLREAQKADPTAKVEATLNSSRRIYDSLKSVTAPSPESEIQLRALRDRIAVLETLVRTPAGQSPSRESTHTSAKTTGNSLVALAEQKLGQKVILGAFVPKDEANWNGPWDNSEFISWVVYQATGRLVGTRPSDDPKKADAFTGFWAEDAKSAGQTISIDDARSKPGAILIRAPAPLRQGRIGVSDGRGGVIEARSSSEGVARTAIAEEGWDFAVFLNGVRH